MKDESRIEPASGDLGSFAAWMFRPLNSGGPEEANRLPLPRSQGSAPETWIALLSRMIPTLGAIGRNGSAPAENLRGPGNGWPPATRFVTGGCGALYRQGGFRSSSLAVWDGQSEVRHQGV